MKFYIKNLAPLLFTLVIVCLPLVGLAEAPANSSNSSLPANWSNSTLASGRLDNPLKVTNFCDLLKIVLQAILIIGMPVAVVFLVIVGFKFILAQGKPEAIGIAQKNLLHTVVGIAIFLGAWTIAKVIAATMAALGVPGLGSCGQ